MHASDVRKYQYKLPFFKYGKKSNILENIPKTSIKKHSHWFIKYTISKPDFMIGYFRFLFSNPFVFTTFLISGLKPFAFINIECSRAPPSRIDPLVTTIKANIRERWLSHSRRSVMTIMNYLSDHYEPLDFMFTRRP